MKKCYLFVALALCLSVTSAIAAEQPNKIPDDKKELLTQLFESMNLDKELKSLAKIMIETVKNEAEAEIDVAIENNLLPENQRDYFKNQFVPEYTKKISEVIEKIFKDKTIVDDIFMPAYAGYLSNDEISKLIEFYDTPIGRKYAEVESDISTSIEKNLVMYLNPKIRSAAALISQEMFTEMTEKSNGGE
ncbi:MAG: DUF2059 domain-containing protein [bacterium]